MERKMDELSKQNEKECRYEVFRKYPPGEYKRKDFLGQPHPPNVVTFKSNKKRVLVSLNYTPVALRAIKIDEPFEDRVFNLVGYYIHVWSEKSPIISVSETVSSVDEIADKIEELKEAVKSACHHKNSISLPQKYHMLYEFLCLDCGEKWGYDSSG